MKKKKVLLLGGAGFIGINITKFLVQNRSVEVTLVDVNFWRDLNYYFSEEEREAINFKSLDLTNTSAYKELDDDYDYVYMLASVVGVNPTLENPEEVIRINISLINNTLEWLKQSKVKKVLFTSSSECYAGTTEAFSYPVPTDEKVPLAIQDISHPRFTYAVTKMLGESAFLNYARKFSFDSTIVRYQNAFGPDMGFKHAVPHIIERFCAGEAPFKIYSHKQTRAFCYISDSAEGTVLAMENDKANGEIYHIGSTEEISMETLTKEIGKILEYKGKFIPADKFPGSVGRRCPDITKARRDLGYDPKIYWKDGLKKTVEWYKEFYESGKKILSGGFVDPENFIYKD